MTKVRQQAQLRQPRTVTPFPRDSHRQITGKICRINDAGLAYVEVVQSGEMFVFTFDKICNYSGETTKELGIRVGTEVLCEVAGGEIDVVQVRTSSTHSSEKSAKAVASGV